MRSGSVIAASDTVAGSARDRGFVPGLHLEPDATGAVRLEDDFTVTKNPRAQIDRRAIEDDHLYRTPDPVFQRRLEFVRLRDERRGRVAGEQHADIDIAAGMGVAARDRPIEIDGGEAGRVRLEVRPQLTKDILVHKPIIKADAPSHRPKHDDRLDPRGPVSGKEARGDGGQQQQRGSHGQRERVARRDVEEQGRQHPSGCDRRRESGRDPGQRDHECRA
jgi:hypothetical protein